MKEADLRINPSTSITSGASKPGQAEDSSEVVDEEALRFALCIHLSVESIPFIGELFHEYIVVVAIPNPTVVSRLP